MSDGNPLVADRVDTTSAFAGAFLLQDGEDLANAISSGDWAAGALAVTSTALDTVGAIIDPIGTLIANGLGWVLDHVEPLKSWFNDFTGDAADVASFSGTWSNTSGYIAQLADSYQGMLSQLDDMAGDGIDAYLGYANAVIANLRAAGEWSNAIAVGLQIASTLVQAVHDIVRDVLSQLVGSAISAAATTAATIGFGAPAAMAQFGIKVAGLVAKVGRVITKVLDALTDFARIFGPLGRVIASTLQKLGLFLRGGIPGGGRTPDAAHVSTGSDGSPNQPPSADTPRDSEVGGLPTRPGSPGAKPEPPTPHDDPEVPAEPQPESEGAASGVGENALAEQAELTESERFTLADATRPDKMDHVFAEKHNFDAIVSRYGSQEAAMEQIVRSLGTDISTNGPRNTFVITRIIAGETVTIRGSIVNGVPRIGTAFIP